MRKLRTHRSSQRRLWRDPIAPGYAHDARGFISQRSLTLQSAPNNTPNSASPITTRTRYQHDAQGQLSAISLSSGH